MSIEGRRFGRTLALTGLGFWVIIGLVDIFDWGAGKERALMLLVVLGGALWLKSRGGVPQTLTPALKRNLKVAAWLFFLYHLISLGFDLVHPHLLDMSTDTLAAGQAILHGQNPYLLPINPKPAMDHGAITYDGWKYLPVMALAYLPLGVLGGERGVQVTNFLLNLLVSGLIYLLLKQVRGSQAALVGIVFYLMLPLVVKETYVKGAVDLVPVSLLLAALGLGEKRPMWAGLLVGFSTAAKLFPGVLFMGLCLPGVGRWRYGGAILLGLTPALVYLCLAPQAFVDNAVLFGGQQTMVSTSWLYGLPPLVGKIARLGGALVIAGVFVYIWHYRPPLLDRCFLGLIAIITTLLGSPSGDRNYSLWWIPLAVIILAAQVFYLPGPKPVPAQR